MHGSRISWLALGIVLILGLQACVTGDQTQNVVRGEKLHALISQKCVIPRLWKQKPALPVQKRDPRYGVNPCDEERRSELLAHLTQVEATEAWNCLQDELRSGWEKSGHPIVAAYPKWRPTAKDIFRGVEQNGCYGQVYVNDAGAPYGNYNNNKLPYGTKIAKVTYGATPEGMLLLGAIPAMEKVKAADTAKSGGWRFIHVLADGRAFDSRTQKGASHVSKCVGCHKTAKSIGDFVFFPPENVRVP